MNWMALLNLAVPAVSQIITIIRHKDGTASAIVLLDEADPLIESDLKQVQDWFAARGKKLP